MKRNFSLAFIILAATLGGCAANKSANDLSLIGSWKGLRVENGKCQFLSWNNNFKPDGSWSAANGRNELRTNGVRLPDVYTYELIDADAVHYVSVASGPSGDCQEDYEFTERRVRG
ncbi:hypothetical protein HX882_21015 [Pseudomonas gingeri]|uniref:Lipoprotein n=1 Tax=Pseudomonas gingeri TaxID=117681 RepID=A0A7Y7XGH5_9PSED|nr:hypothetical protein [Pseudomonas gingeri]